MTSMKQYVTALGLMIACVIVYGRSVNNGYGWDDQLLVFSLPAMEAPDGWKSIWAGSASVDYWPVTYCAFWIQYRLFGDHPMNYHITSLVLHICCVLLVYMILTDLGFSFPGSAALLFAVHPVGVEAVCWIFQQKTLWSIFFGLAAILAFRRDRASLGLILFGLAMLAKTHAIFVPFLLILLDWHERRLTLRSAIRVAPFFLVAIVLGAIAVYFQATKAIAGGEPLNESVAIRVLNAPAIAGFQWAKAMVPVNLCFIYPRWEISVQAAWLWGSIAAWVCVLSIGVAYRESWGRQLLCLALGYVLILGPTLGIVDFYYLRFSWVADHYQYPALPLAAVLIMSLMPRIVGANRVPMLLIPLAILFAYSAHKRTKLFADEVTLWREVSRCNEKAPWIVPANLAASLAKRGEWKGALTIMRNAVLKFPDNGRLHNDLGVLLDRLGQPKAALEHYRLAVKYSPQLAVAHNSLGASLSEAGDTTMAKACWEEALRRQPDYITPLLNLADLARKENRHNDSIKYLNRAIAIRPWNANLRMELARALLDSNEPDAALRHLTWASRCDPNNHWPHQRAAVICLRLELYHHALTHFGCWAQLQPDSAEAQEGMAICYSKMRMAGMASEHRVAAKQRISPRGEQ